MKGTLFNTRLFGGERHGQILLSLREIGLRRQRAAELLDGLV